jgi:hypothetical protein
MRRMVIVGAALTLSGCGVGNAGSGGESVVAHGEHLALHRDTLAAIVVSGKNVPTDRELVERWAFRWVEFALFTERLAEGDSLLDSATVVRAMWTEANQLLVDAYHDKLAAERVRVDSATIDSAYAAGDHRLIYHILVRMRPDMSPPDRTDARRRAEAVRERLAAGGTWEVENDLNEDPVARRAGGSLGVIERGQMVAPFEDVAFQLEPGELSDVIETQYGYHVVRRPPLDEVRAPFTAEVSDILTVRMDSTVLREIEERWKVRVEDDAPALMREAAAGPLRTYQDPQTLGRYGRSAFTTVDFVRWMQAMPTEVYRQVPGATDEQLADLLHSLIRNEALVREAHEEGMALEPDSLTALRQRLAQELEQVRSITGLDSAMAGLDETEERLAAGAAAIRDYFRRVANNAATVVIVPPFLAHTLRGSMDWEVSQRAIDAALERIVRLRQQQLEPSGVPPILPPSETADDSIAKPDDAS